MPANEHFRLVFCGGTCLSKAYGVVERMSEDVDFKVVPVSPRSLSRNALRERLRSFRSSVKSALNEAGFVGEGSFESRIRDEGAYAGITLGYESAFEKPISLRPHLLIELNFTELSGATTNAEIGLLIDRMMGLPTEKSVHAECASIGEVLAEKLVAFPRRLGKHFDDRKGLSKPGAPLFCDKYLDEESGWDRSLVRHLYDVHSLLHKHPDLAGEGLDLLVAAAIQKDSVDFKSSHRAFIDDPSSELIACLAFAKNSQALRSQYERFIEDMVYGPHRPSYGEAISEFEKALTLALQSRETDSSRHSAGQSSQPGGMRGC